MLPTFTLDRLCPWCLRRPTLADVGLCQNCILAIEWMRNVAVQDRVAALYAQAKALDLEAEHFLNWGAGSSYA